MKVQVELTVTPALPGRYHSALTRGEVLVGRGHSLNLGRNSFLTSRLAVTKLLHNLKF